jgi:flavin-dependent dehydrogenase
MFPALTPEPAELDADVVVIGGSFAGSSTALLLRRLIPGARVIVVERQERLSRKVGEATVECSAFFLHRILGLYDFLSREQLPKHGLRYWFHSHPDQRLEELTEIGPAEPPTLPSFQLDRAKMDEHLLSLCAQEGAEVIRPAKVVDLEPGWPASRLEIETHDGVRRTLTTRWVVDATGRQSLLAKRLKLRKPVEEHRTGALWARWQGVKDLDGPEVIGADPRSPRLPPLHAARRLATNHFCGYGWWIWVIPLAGGQTSVGVVWDKDLFEPPGGGTLKQRYLDFVRSVPGLRELLDGATIDDDDFLALSNIPYRTERYMDRGWALVADAAAFMDPYYSPGLDHAAMSVWSTVRVLEHDLGAERCDHRLEQEIADHNDRFLRSYPRWISALYLGKYEILGDAELTACSFYVDTSLYYLGVVTQVYRDPDALRWPTFGLPIPGTRIAAAAMRGFKRRMVTIARQRRAVGTYGRRNSGWRVYGKSLGLGVGALPMLLQGLRLWARLEVGHALSRLRHPGRRQPQPNRPLVLADVSLD